MKRIILLCIGHEDYASLKTHLDAGWSLDPQFNGGHAIALTDRTIWPLVLYESEAEKVQVPTPGEYDDIVDVKDAAHSEVAGLIKEGYRLHNVYQKNSILVKRANGGSPH